MKTLTNIILVTLISGCAMINPALPGQDKRYLVKEYHPREHTLIKEYDTNGNGLVDEIYYYQKVKDIWELKYWAYDFFPEDGKIDVIKQPHSNKNKGYIIMTHNLAEVEQ